MKRKLIETYQENLIVCDNTICDFKIKNEMGDMNEDISMYLNMPCPKCGENLLTEEDFKLMKKLTNVINFINKWFSWIVYVVPRKKINKENMTKIHVHKGINLYEKKY